ncbi:hypothetical protein GGR92_005256 [Spirosoma lacussanchae]
MKTFDITYFNASPSFTRIGKALFKPYNLFNRQNMLMADGTVESHWGCGLLQLNNRHLFYIGKGPDLRIYVVFIRIA